MVSRSLFADAVQKNRHRLPSIKLRRATFSLPVNHSQTSEKKQHWLTAMTPIDFAFGSSDDGSKGTAIALQKVYSARESLQNPPTRSRLVLYREDIAGRPSSMQHCIE